MIDFLLVPVPTKSEVYPDLLPGVKGLAELEPINPYGRKFLLQLSTAGVEAVDLLPSYLQVRKAEGIGLYQPQDTHWTDRGLRLAARMIGERVRRLRPLRPLRAGGPPGIAPRPGTPVRESS